MISLCLCVASVLDKSPIFVARQLVKHQVGLSWHEVSRRYVDGPTQFYQPVIWRGRPSNSKQGSDGEAEDQTKATSICQQTSNASFKNYHRLLEEGLAPEQARMILPQTMMTKWYWSGSLQAFARVCNQRLDDHSQEKTQVIARIIQ